MKKISVLFFVLISAQISYSSDFFYSKARFVPDGDTLILTDKIIVRYIGIDSPEINHETGKPQSFALEAKKFNQELVWDKKLKIVPGREKTDSYKRILAYVYLPDGRMVNRLILDNGLGWVYWHSDNKEYFDEFLDAQKKAMRAGAGLWGQIAGIDLPVKINPESKRFHSFGCKRSGKYSSMEKNPFNAFYKGYSPSRRCIENIFEY